MTSSRQVTLARRARLAGHGVHSGKPVSLILHPAADHHGIRFLRTGLEGGRERLINARHDAVSASELCTIIGDHESGAVLSIKSQHVVICAC